MSNKATMSQKAARDGLGSPQLFEGGVYVTKNGVAELFVQTAAEREAELNELARERELNALGKILMRGKNDIARGRKSTPKEALKILRETKG